MSGLKDIKWTMTKYFEQIYTNILMTLMKWTNSLENTTKVPQEEIESGGSQMVEHLPSKNEV
jgi:hypothetical protein